MNEERLRKIASDVTNRMMSSQSILLYGQNMPLYQHRRSPTHVGPDVSGEATDEELAWLTKILELDGGSATSAFYESGIGYWRIQASVPPDSVVLDVELSSGSWCIQETKP